MIIFGNDTEIVTARRAGGYYSSSDNAPRTALARHMPWHAIAPTDKVLSFANVLHVHRNHSGRALFDRCFPGENKRCSSGRCCDPRMLRSPGATVSLLTNAVGVRAVLEYDDCRTSCAGKYPACYVPLRQCSDGGPNKGSHQGCSSRRSEAYCIAHKKAKCGGVCKNHCEPKLYVNGARLPLPAVSTRDRYDGLVTLDLLAVSGLRERRIDMVMPWGGEVRFASLQLRTDSPEELSLRRAPTPRFTYVAYGDSITGGSCAETPYPELIGRLNGWNALNLGLNGLAISPSHGAAVGAIAAPNDLVSVLIGTNNQHTCDIATPFGEFLDGLRSKNPSASVVVVTPLVRNDEGTSNATWGNGRCITVEEHREQLRSVVRVRQASDRHLHLVEGKTLLSLDQLVDGVHPRDGSAMNQIAVKLNAEFHQLKLASRFTCYAEHHPDLRRAHCQDVDLARCNYVALMDHWERAGRKEGRTIDCSPRHSDADRTAFKVVAHGARRNARRNQTNDGGESMLSVAGLPPGLTAGALLAAIAVVAQLVSHRGGAGRTRRTTASAPSSSVRTLH